MTSTQTDDGSIDQRQRDAHVAVEHGAHPDDPEAHKMGAAWRTLMQEPLDLTPEERAASRERAATALEGAAADIAPADPDPDPDPDDDGSEIDHLPNPDLARILELAGFGGIRQAVMTAMSGIANQPVEVLEAAIAYNDRAAARLELSTAPNARDARLSAARHGRYLRLALRWRRDLGKVEAAIEATERIAR